MLRFWLFFFSHFPLFSTQTYSGGKLSCVGARSLCLAWGELNKSNILSFQSLPQPSRAAISPQPPIPRGGYSAKKKLFWAKLRPRGFSRSLLLRTERSRGDVCTPRQLQVHHFFAGIWCFFHANLVSPRCSGSITKPGPEPEDFRSVLMSCSKKKSGYHEFPDDLWENFTPRASGRVRAVLPIPGHRQERDIATSPPSIPQGWPCSHPGGTGRELFPITRKITKDLGCPKLEGCSAGRV